MIPETEQQLATMIFLMEINEWGTEISDKLCTKLANESLLAAETFFRVADQRREMTIVKPAKPTRAQKNILRIVERPTTPATND